MPGIHDVAREAGVRTDILSNVFEAILAAITRGEAVRIKNFGTFERRKYKGRTLVTPAVNAGKPVEYPDSFVLKFRQSQIAKRRINVVAKKAAKAASQEAPKKKSKKPAAPEAAPAKKKAAKKPAADE
jgi:nucleoid DNA-binding protein